MTDSATPPAPTSPPGSWTGLALSAALTAVVLTVLALEGGGYDVVPRQASAVVLWWAVLLGALIAGRRLTLPSAATIAATCALLGLALWAGVTAGSSLSAERSAVEVARWVAYAAPVVLVGWVLPRPLWRGVVVGATLGATIVSLLALGERLSPGLLSDTRTVVFENQSQRLVEPLGYWNALGSWGAMTLLLLFGVAGHARHAAVRAIALLPVPAIGVMVYVTYSRSSILVTVVGIAVLVALARNRWTLALQLAVSAAAVGVSIAATDGQEQIAKATGDAGAGSVLLTVLIAGIVVAAVGAGSSLFDTDRLRLPYRTARTIAFAASALVLAFGVAAAITEGPAAWDKFTTVEADTNADPSARLTMVSNGNRVAQWRVALDSWKSDRWTGSGAGTFELTYNRNGDDGQFVRDAHSAPLEMLSELGVPGLALLLTLIGAAAGAGFIAVRHAASDLDRGLAAGGSAALAAFLLGTCFDWFWEVGALALLAMTLLGALGAAGSHARSRRNLPGLSLLVAGIALIALLVQMPGLVGTSELRRSQQAVNSGDLSEARDRADEAIDIQPWASSPFLQRALVDERDGQWAASLAALHLAIDRDPYDWRLPLVLARVEAKAGHPDEALAAYRDAKRLRPNGRFFR